MLNKIFISYWIKKDNQEYGCIIVNPTFFNEKGELKGKTDFYRNALSMITGLKIQIIIPGKEIVLE